MGVLPVAAQDWVVVEDPSGDVVAGTSATNLAPYPSNQPTQDLASLSILETLETMTFAVDFHASAIDQGNMLVQPADLDLWFEHGGRRYRVDYTPPAEVSSEGAALYRVDALGSDHYVGPVGINDDGYITGTYKVEVPRDRLIDVQGAAPFPGSPWSNFEVRVGHAISPVSVGPLQENGRLDAMDRMPDVGVSGSYTTVLGPQPVGHVRLFSPMPSRASNGAAAIYVFNATIINQADATERFELTVLDAPKAFKVQVPVQVVEVTKQGAVSVPVFVETPFQHSHGKREVVSLEVRGIDDPSSHALLELSIHYHDIPQPAGHHPTLWLHSDSAGNQAEVLTTLLGDSTQRLYMNTLKEDPGDQGIAVHGTNDNVVRDQVTWRATLVPNLEMGLDFDLAGFIDMRFPLRSDSLFPDTNIEVALVHVAPSNTGSLIETTLAQGVVFSGDVAPGTLEVVASLPPELQADLLPPHPEGRLELRVTAILGRPTTYLDVEAPKFLPGGHITLPLHEYRDALPTEFISTVQGLSWETSVSQGRASPGEVVVYDLRLHAATGGEIQTTLTGVNADWARLVGDTSPYRDGETRSFQVIVKVPDDAADRDVADLIVSANRPDQNPASIRLLTIVVKDLGQMEPETPASDFSSSSPPGNSASGLGAFGFSLALLAIALARYASAR